MSEIKHKYQILEAIDHLRSRKSRPDINRICKFMLKCFKVSTKDTKADLKRCIKEKSIIKVDYKDNVSYRNAAKWRKKTNVDSKMASTIATNERRIITSAIATLIYQDQSYLENGIAFDDLIKTATSQDSKYSKKQLEAMVNKELISGSLVKLPNGNLALGPADHDGDSSDSFKFEDNVDSKMTSSANSSCRSSPQRVRGRPKKRGGIITDPSANNNTTNLKNAGVRVGERRKMAKKVFDPSDNNIPSKRKRGRPVGSLNKSTIIKKRLLGNSKNDKEDTMSDSQITPECSGDEIDPEDVISQETSGGVCSVCLVLKARGSNDKLIECRDCNNKAHLNCLQSGSGILKPRPDNTWQCPHCKTCVVCCETNDAGILTVCTICSDAYHSLCHTPHIPDRLKAWDQWECNNCLESKPTIVSSPAIIPSNIEYGKQNQPLIDPFLKPHELDRAPSKLREDVPIDPTIPDITNWTVEQVYEYFMDHHPEAAPLLKEQEFDGQALSMARRADIVRGLGLPLGPALTLYRIVVKLQTRKDDWTMCWG
ncbi:hypothetical protein ACJJTC_008973 [Scirpophaga incertulas]